MSKAYCGICPVNEKYECCICFGHLCKSERHNNAICFNCRISPKIVASFPRDEQDHTLHPVTQTRLCLCQCGAVANNVCSTMGHKSSWDYISTWSPLEE